MREGGRRDFVALGVVGLLSAAVVLVGRSSSAPALRLEVPQSISAAPSPLGTTTVVHVGHAEVVQTVGTQQVITLHNRKNKTSWEMSIALIDAPHAVSVPSPVALTDTSFAVVGADQTMRAIDISGRILARRSVVLPAALRVDDAHLIVTDARGQVRAPISSFQ